MENYAKKAKITLPSKKIFLLDKWKLLMSFATIMYVIAFITPWIREHYVFNVMHPEIYPSPAIQHEGWFSSFLAIIGTTRNGYRISLFRDYWFDVNSIFSRIVLWMDRNFHIPVSHRTYGFNHSSSEK